MAQSWNMSTSIRYLVYKQIEKFGREFAPELEKKLIA